MPVRSQESRSASSQSYTAQILLVDDDPIILDSMAAFLRMEGFDVSTASNLRDAMLVMERDAADLVMSDINMTGGDGFELLHNLRKRWPETIVLMMTAYGTIESAVEAIKMGAYDYLTKPIVDDEVLLAIQRGLAQQTLVRENRSLKKQLNERFGLANLIGHDYRMQKIFDLIEAVAGSNVTVLVQGPSGTGKSLVARIIHQLSERRNRPFVEVACGAMPEGLLESELFGHVRGAFTGAVSNKQGKFSAADGGTLFLDEIGTASPALQVKLLRVLQTHQFEPLGSNKTEQSDVRVVLATNLNLEKEVREGRFREDLYYRINVVTIEMPRLADRVSDIPLLAGHFLDQYRAESRRKLDGFTQDAIRMLQAYAWPGNVRELENTVERAVVLAKGPMITPEDLPDRLHRPAAGSAGDEADPAGAQYRAIPLRDALEGPERRIIEAALRANHWNRQLTAQQLDINRTTLYKKMKRYGLLEHASSVPS